jgi:hypothetical protein
MRKQPKHIIACKMGGRDNYILNAVLLPNNKRKPTYTTDVEKARRFFDKPEAGTFISQLLIKPGLQHTVEDFVPASINHTN